jgi:hypothetical protein
LGGSLRTLKKNIESLAFASSEVGLEVNAEKTEYVVMSWRPVCRDEVTGDWRRLHNEQFYDLYSSPNIIWMIKLRKIRWAGHLACMEERRGVYMVLVRRPAGKKHVKDLGIVGR